jgi:CDP-diglyceride synthetase
MIGVILLSIILIFIFNYLIINLIKYYIFYILYFTISQLGDLLFHILKDSQKLKIQENYYLVMVDS